MNQRMLTIGLSLGVFSFSSLTLWGDEKQVKADLKALQGTWELVSAHRHGKDATAAMPKGYQLTFREDRWIVRFEGRTPFDEDAFRIKIIPAKAPKEFDLTTPPLITSNSGPPIFLELPGIYQIEGDTLKLCWDVGRATGRRPNRFETEPGTAFLSLVLKRVKKKD